MARHVADILATTWRKDTNGPNVRYHMHDLQGTDVPKKPPRRAKFSLHDRTTTVHADCGPTVTGQVTDMVHGESNVSGI